MARPHRLTGLSIFLIALSQVLQGLQHIIYFQSQTGQFIPAVTPFEAPSEKRIRWELELPAERVVALYLTPSGMASLPEEERDELRETLERALSGTYRLPIETQVDWTRLR